VNDEDWGGVGRSLVMAMAMTMPIPMVKAEVDVDVEVRFRAWLRGRVRNVEGGGRQYGMASGDVGWLFVG
jgi:hypothetical protein